MDLIPEKSLVLFGNPFILNCDTIYYLYGTNSGNGIEVYKSKDLLSWSGPWIKYEKNPILQKPGNLLGIGYSAMFTDNNCQLKIVYHSHSDANKIHPRIVHISNVKFVKDKNYNYEILEIDLSDLDPLYKTIDNK